MARILGPSRAAFGSPLVAFTTGVAALRFSTEVQMARYGKGARKAVKRSMHARKRGTLESGRSGRRVKSRRQAIAIGLSEARRKGAKVPARKRSSRKSSRRRARR
jgi:hypothetical protein